ncbi:unnamed protein product, partial [Amoebophrya sp. A25]
TERGAGYHSSVRRTRAASASGAGSGARDLSTGPLHLGRIPVGLLQLLKLGDDTREPTYVWDEYENRFIENIDEKQLLKMG